MKAKPQMKQNLSKDMKKQGHTGSRKPNNNKLSSENSLSEKPKKGQHREPSSKKLSSETFLQKSHKLVHLKEFAEFINESAYPTLDEVEKASPDQIMKWQRFLPSPSGKSETDVINLIFDKYSELKSKGYIDSSTSKKVGW